MVYFDGAYYEPSARGYHICVLVRVGRCPREAFNRKLKDLASKLRQIVGSAGYRSTVEVVGGFTVIDWNEKVPAHRGRMAPVPVLPRGMCDLDRLRNAPVFLPSALGAVQPVEAHPLLLDESDWDEDLWTGDHLLPEVCVSNGKGKGRFSVMNSDNAWERMQSACFHSTQVYRRLPNVEELLDRYRQVYNTDQADESRHRRAEDAIKRRTRTFDPE